MRAAFGDIVAAGGADLTNALFAECCAIATTQGFAPSETTIKFSRGMFNAPRSTIMASMLRPAIRWPLYMSMAACRCQRSPGAARRS